MKKIIYGRTGYGKSYTYIAPIIKESDNVLLITPNISNELKYMGISKNTLKEIKPKDILNISSGKFGVLVTKENVEELYKILEKLDTTGLSENDNFTVIFINPIMYLHENLDLIKRMNKWKCNIIFEHTCNSNEAYRELNLSYYCWNDWVLVPVFERLYEGN